MEQKMKMTKRANKSLGHYRWLCMMGYYRTPMLMAMLTLVYYIFGLPTAIAAVDNWDVEGANGSIYVHGILTESACRLEMTTARQDILLGGIGSGHLQKKEIEGNLSGLNCVLLTVCKV
jgi:hypothetical protein